MRELHTKYRPTEWEEIIGQPAAVESVMAALEEGRSRAFIFAGPSGVGKTTISRIIAGEMEAELMEIDAATHTGVDAMRDVQQMTQYAPLNAPSRVIIVDECHMLSKSAWNSMLKVIEEPPKNVLWCLCTTELEKVPETIKTRCLVYTLQLVDAEALMQLLTHIDAEEGSDANQDVMWLCAEKADGSPRRAITMFSQVMDCETRAEAAILLRQPLEDGEVIDLCRLMAQGAPWDKIIKLLKKLEKQNPESIRRIICAYFSKVAMKESFQKAQNALAILQAFERPYPTEQSHHLLLSFGELYAE